MRETPDELTALQDLLDRSFAEASAHLRGIMAAERRLTAERIVAEVPSPAVLNLATVTARGQPRLSAVDGHFLHGRWYFTTAGDSPKAVQLAARPAVSASYTPRDGYGIFCHGYATFLDGDARQMLVDHCTRVYGRSPETFGEGVVYVRIDPDWLVGFAFSEEEMAAFLKEREELAAQLG
ncbi:MAG TPA: pyridoxamine 5'-phosphate oxidase family protein [Jatrophihabitans sp.]|nr:pyridoxamine 5'-phosphate oxidase family protein [Jatrophihabitans sp.]